MASANVDPQIQNKLYGTIVTYKADTDPTRRYHILGHPRLRKRDNLAFCPLKLVPPDHIENLLAEHRDYQIPSLYVYDGQRQGYVDLVFDPNPHLKQVAITTVPEEKVYQRYCSHLGFVSSPRVTPQHIDSDSDSEDSNTRPMHLANQGPRIPIIVAPRAPAPQAVPRPQIIAAPAPPVIQPLQPQQQPQVVAIPQPPPLPPLVNLGPVLPPVPQAQLNRLLQLHFAQRMAAAQARRENCKQWSRTITTCDGSKPEALRAWLSEMDSADGVPAQDLDTIDLVRATVSGQLRRFVMSQGHRNQGWNNLRPDIITEFLTGQDLTATRSLRGIKQGKRSVREYIDLYTDTADTAHPGMRGAQLDQVLARGFIDGIVDGTLKFQLSQANHATLAAATAAAKTLAVHVDASANAVSVVASMVEKFDTQLTSKLDRLESRLSDQVAEVAAVQTRAQTKANTQSRPQGPRQQGKRPDSTGCYNCGSQDHFRRDCPRGRNTAPGPPGGNCERCRQSGHIARNCRKGPPTKPCPCGELHWRYDCSDHSNHLGSPSGN